ncbi:MAG: HAMP domain-containing histidine kinase [Anaerolineae bacterium]|nr:HAMP domain-containing histidine kinase [Anaerolineae bacterium]
MWNLQEPSGLQLDHRGAISPESTPDQGCTFHVYLPLAGPDQGERPGQHTLHR